MENSNRSNIILPIHLKYTRLFHIIEIILLIFIFIEQTFIFLLTFKRNTFKRTDNDSRSIIYPRKTFLYNCLHRNWIRAFSFSNISLSITYFLLFILKSFYPHSIQILIPTLYSLPLNLFEQLNINFTNIHLFLISIHVFEHFLRLYRYTNSYFNYQNILLTKHTNVALILTGSLALIFSYNFVFYYPKDLHGKSFLPLITLNMFLLLIINIFILILIILSFILNSLYKYHFDNNDQDNIRIIIERNTCMKCYMKISDNNSLIFQDSNEISYRMNYFSKDILPRKYHCHLCFTLLIIFLIKYILLTFPQNILHIYIYFKQFYYFIWKNEKTNEFLYLFNENLSWKFFTHICFLFSRLGDSFLLIRLSFIIKKYFPCWCQFNSNYFSKKSFSQSSISRRNFNENSHRYRLRVQYLPLWSSNRPRLFPKILDNEL